MTTVEAPAELYRVQIRRALSDVTPDAVQAWEAARHLPRMVIAKLGADGVFRSRWEPGALAGLPHLVVLSEELLRCNAGLAVAAIGHSEIFIGALTRLAFTSGQHNLLEEALLGRAVGCFAATEPHGGSSLADVRSTATPVAGGWRVAGTKRYVCNVGSATHSLVLTRAHGTEDRSDLSLFVLPLATPGVTCDGFFDMSGVQACDVGQITFDVTLPHDALLGRPGLGMLYASHLLQFERMSICAQLIAAGELALSLATAYARRRNVSGRRVMDRQVIRHRLAYARAELWSLHSRLTDLVGVASNSGGMPAHEIAGLKLLAGQRVTKLIDMCMQVFGARGNTPAYTIEKLVRDCRTARVGGGTDEVLADVIASLLDRPDPEAETRLDLAAAVDTPISDSHAWRH